MRAQPAGGRWGRLRSRGGGGHAALRFITAPRQAPELVRAPPHLRSVVGRPAGPAGLHAATQAGRKALLHEARHGGARAPGAPRRVQQLAAALARYGVAHRHRAVHRLLFARKGGALEGHGGCLRAPG